MRNDLRFVYLNSLDLTAEKILLWSWDGVKPLLKVLAPYIVEAIVSSLLLALLLGALRSVLWKLGFGSDDTDRAVRFVRKLNDIVSTIRDIKS